MHSYASGYAQRAIPHEPIDIDFSSTDPKKPWVLHMVGLPATLEIELVDRARAILRQQGAEHLVHARLLNGKSVGDADAAIRQRYQLTRCNTLIFERSDGTSRGLLATRNNMERFLCVVAALARAANNRRQ